MEQEVSAITHFQYTDNHSLILICIISLGEDTVPDEIKTRGTRTYTKNRSIGKDSR